MNEHTSLCDACKFLYRRKLKKIKERILYLVFNDFFLLVENGPAALALRGVLRIEAVRAQKLLVHDLEGVVGQRGVALPAVEALVVVVVVLVHDMPALQRYLLGALGAVPGESLLVADAAVQLAVFLEALVVRQGLVALEAQQVVSVVELGAGHGVLGGEDEFVASVASVRGWNQGYYREYWVEGTRFVKTLISLGV